MENGLRKLKVNFYARVELHLPHVKNTLVLDLPGCLVRLKSQVTRSRDVSLAYLPHSTRGSDLSIT